ncbi:intra-flagellar transport protein 57 [Zopfochytrium polystomum]|nr:intra-flagellar transport protein 57 [Zopfochytrium polystomum]
MDEVLDKLKVLRYQRDFCREGGFQSLNKYYFLLPAPNPNEQFFYFTSLCSWLLLKIGVQFEAPGQFDDPNASAADIANELKKLGVAFEFGPHKLKQGYGDAVVFSLQVLTDKLIQHRGVAFTKPVHKVDDYPDEAEVDVDAEVTAETIEETIAAHDDDEELFMDASPAASKMEDSKPLPVIQPTVDPSEWILEVERVAPMLKVQITNDNKDWRLHLEHMQQHHSTIATSLSETRGQLSKLQADIEKTLEKISSREKYINTQFETQIEEQRSLQDQLSELRQKYNVASTSVNELSNELGRVSEELDSVKNRMDEIGNGMTDSQPLVDIKKGTSRLKFDIKQMDLRIGVIEQTLLQAKLKNKGPMLAMPAFNPTLFV